MSQPYRRTVNGAVIKVKLLPVTELGLENEKQQQTIKSKNRPFLWNQSSYWNSIN